MINGWIGIDLDGTLAYYEGWVDDLHIGEPIVEMVRRVKAWILAGHDVRVFTARVADDETGEIAEAIRVWCRCHVGRSLPVTCRKDRWMVCLYDDRCRQVVMNTGEIVGEPHE